MSVLFEKVAIFFFLFLGFFLLFIFIDNQDFINKIVINTKAKITKSLRQRLLENRTRLSEGNIEQNIWNHLEREIYYSGMKWETPFLHILNAEIFVAFNICVLSLCVVLILPIFGIKGMLTAIVLFLVFEYIVFKIKRTRTNNIINSCLPKFLDFLGNYSITSGEIISVFKQISIYMDEPLKTILEECCNEAEFTGDVELALLTMREKVEHPQFKEMVSNIEINLRYCADFASIVQGSKRSLSEYIRALEERKSMFREAGINMVILLAMSIIALIAVDGLIPNSIWSIVFFTLPGRIATGIVAIIIFLFWRQVYGKGK